MTAYEAKELSLKLWGWLKDNPDKGKENSPYWEEVKDLDCRCPLCEYTFNDDTCERCPLFQAGEYCNNDDSAYDIWSDIKGGVYYGEGNPIEVSRKCATKIYNIIEAWVVEE